MMSRKPVLRVLFITNHGIQGASARFRVYQYLPYLRTHGFECKVLPFTSDVAYPILHEQGHWGKKASQTLVASIRRLVSLREASQFDLIFLHREAMPFGYPLAENLLARRQALVYDFDDPIHLHFPHATGSADRLLYRLKYPRNIQSFLGSCRSIIAGSVELEIFASRHSANVYRVPTVVDTDVYVPWKHRTGQAVRVGWIGSSSTAAHVDLVRPTLARLKARYGARLDLVLIGVKPSQEWTGIATTIPWSLGKELQLLQSFDIGIMPLHDDAWTRAKCAFKAVEYMAVGIPTVASPVGEVRNTVRDGVDGFLPATADDWYSAIELLLNDGDTRALMGRAARERAVERFSLQATASTVAGILERSAR
jgi:glycosyltransferase involved in cell wall biosynthesis